MRNFPSCQSIDDANDGLAHTITVTLRLSAEH